MVEPTITIQTSDKDLEMVLEYCDDSRYNTISVDLFIVNNRFLSASIPIGYFFVLDMIYLLSKTPVDGESIKKDNVFVTRTKDKVTIVSAQWVNLTKPPTFEDFCKEDFCLEDSKYSQEVFTLVFEGKEKLQELKDSLAELMFKMMETNKLLILYPDCEEVRYEQDNKVIQFTSIENCSLHAFEDSYRLLDLTKNREVYKESTNGIGYHFRDVNDFNKKTKEVQKKILIYNFCRSMTKSLSLKKKERIKEQKTLAENFLKDFEIES